jgi:hypothetical protein
MTWSVASAATCRALSSRWCHWVGLWKGIGRALGKGAHVLDALATSLGPRITPEVAALPNKHSDNCPPRYDRSTSLSSSFLATARTFGQYYFVPYDVVYRPQMVSRALDAPPRIATLDHRKHGSAPWP